MSLTWERSVVRYSRYFIPGAFLAICDLQRGDLFLKSKQVAGSREGGCSSWSGGLEGLGLVRALRSLRLPGDRARFLSSQPTADPRMIVRATHGSLDANLTWTKKQEQLFLNLCYTTQSALNIVSTYILYKILIMNHFIFFSFCEVFKIQCAFHTCNTFQFGC